MIRYRSLQRKLGTTIPGFLRFYSVFRRISLSSDRADLSSGSRENFRTANATIALRLQPRIIGFELSDSLFLDRSGVNTEVALGGAEIHSEYSQNLWVMQTTGLTTLGYEPSVSLGILFFRWYASLSGPQSRTFPLVDESRVNSASSARPTCNIKGLPAVRMCA